MNVSTFKTRFEAVDYDLAATLDSGQAFRWESTGSGWEAVVGQRWVCLEPCRTGILARTVIDPGDWGWLRTYLQLDVQLAPILESFPRDRALQEAVVTCRGLRLIRQDPWECLASFLLSSTKQIVQIRQGIRLICERFGTAIPVPAGHAPAYAFPSAGRLASASEAGLRECRIGFRAPYLLQAARTVSEGALRLEELREMSLEDARGNLMRLDGVGRKIADCVLLFAYGFATAFPVDVWILKALQELYFEGQRPSRAAVGAFSMTHFGPWGGYAQQYLFHFMRLRAGRVSRSATSSAQESSHAA